METNLSDIDINPKKIKFLKEITNNSFSDWIFENTFIVFKTINDFFLLIYATELKSIIIYDLKNFKIISEIKNSHEEFITNFSHCYEKNIKADLIMSVSRNNNNIKIWEIKYFQCLLNLKAVNTDGLLNSSAFLNYNNNLYIITSNRNWTNPEPIKVFDLKGNKIRELLDLKVNSFFIDIYYDNKNSKIYILSGNEGNSFSYDFKEKEIYKIYQEKFENNIFHHSLVVFEDKNDKITKLIESLDGNGIINIWNFHLNELLRKIECSNKSLRCIVLWNSDYLFVGCGDKTIKLIEIENGRIINSLIGHNKNVCSFKIIFHPTYGKCIISQGHENDQIKLWGYS